VRLPLRFLDISPLYTSCFSAVSPAGQPLYFWCFPGCFPGVFPVLPKPARGNILPGIMRADPTTYTPVSASMGAHASERPAGLVLRCASAAALAESTQAFLRQLETLELRQCVELRTPSTSPTSPNSATSTPHDFEQGFYLRADLSRIWAPEHDTTSLHLHLEQRTVPSDDELEREIVAAMLLSPLAFDFPSHAELAAAVRMRRNIVVAARQTALAFGTLEADRPEDCWTYLQGKGFVVKPGCALIAALIKATQPEASGRLYSFSCYRATEYVILLAMAQELESSNPELLARLQQQWEQRPIMSGQFHDVFLHESGSMQAPLPAGYYVPGDRLWFRNPDAHSSDASGYEGSWVFYLGGGLFSNFWKRGQSFTLTDKCVELYHWRDATFTDAEGELRVDESIVAQRAAQTLSDAAQTARVMHQMLRLRDAKGVYAAGGCIDTTREAPRHVCPATTDIALPRN
jgi:Protein-glutamine gamma-glutamyltransferase